MAELMRALDLMLKLATKAKGAPLTLEECHGVAALLAGWLCALGQGLSPEEVAAVARLEAKAARTIH